MPLGSLDGYCTVSCAVLPVALAPTTCAKPPVVLPWLGYEEISDVLLRDQDVKGSCENLRGAFDQQIQLEPSSWHVVELSQECSQKVGETLVWLEAVSRGAIDDVEESLCKAGGEIGHRKRRWGDQESRQHELAPDSMATPSDQGGSSVGRWRKKGPRFSVDVASHCLGSASTSSASSRCRSAPCYYVGSNSFNTPIAADMHMTSGAPDLALPALGIKFLYASPLCSNVAQLPPLNVQSEYSVMLDALEHCGVLPHVSLDVSAATVESLSRVGTESPKSSASCTWWHLSAHCILDASGNETGRLVLEDADGGAHAVPATAASLGALRAPFGALVLACGSVAVGRMLLECGSMFAIVAQGRLLDMAACAFTSHFYKVLLAKWPQRHHGNGAVRRTSSAYGDDGAHAVLPEFDAEGRAQEAIAVKAAFEVAKEALRMSQSKALQSEADKLILLETRRVLQRPLGIQALVARSASSCSDFSSSVDLCSERGAADLRPAVPCPWGIGKESGAPRDDVAFWFSRKGPSVPEDAEDAVCRESELLALNMLLGSRERRIAVLWGPAGCGKSVLLANFCSFAAAPGRRFSAVQVSGRWHHRVAFVSLKDLDLPSGEEAKAMIRWAAGGLVLERDLAKPSCLTNLSLQDRVCLVVDHADPEFGWEDSIVPELLKSFPRLSLLLARRSPLRESEETGYRWKISDVPVSPLSALQAASVFLKRIHRPLTEADFSTTCHMDNPLMWDQSLLFRLAAHPTLAACKGNPRCLVRLAARVTQELPSLLDVVVGISSISSSCSDELSETATEADVMVPYLQTSISLMQHTQEELYTADRDVGYIGEEQDADAASRWLTRMRCGWPRSYKRLDPISRSPRQCISQGQAPLSTGNTLLCTGAVVACCPFNPFIESEEIVFVHEGSPESIIGESADVEFLGEGL